MGDSFNGDIESLFADYAESLSIESVPDSVVERAKLVTLDTLGIAIYGSGLGYIGAVLEQSESFFGNPPPQMGATSFATWRKHSPILAAEANATAASSTEYYEGTQGAGMPGIHVVPAALAIAEHLEIEGHRILESIILGYEVATRVGGALRPMIGDLHGHGGNHPVGVAATVGYLLDLKPDKFANALRIAASPFVIGDWNAILEGATVRNYYSGACVTHGMRAALLGAAGIEGMSNAIEECLVGHLRESPPDDSLLPEFSTLGEDFRLAGNLFKMYPSCRYTHAPLEAIQTLQRDHRIGADDLRSITVKTTEFATYGDIQRPRTLVDARYSIPFVLATNLVNGSVDLQTISQNSIRDSTVLDVAELISVEADSAYEQRARDNQWGAGVEIELRDGTRLHEHVHDAMSGIDPAATEIIEKFRTTVDRCELPVDDQRLIDACMELETIENFGDVFAN